ncbi:MAG TPA: D-alanyl-D-alanine carboxypeptidase family protein [Chiayiivirga sp.]|nr:D-alanyl-D-alanine carboxypeptidase family protein [Chiayiivirga sp.]
MSYPFVMHHTCLPLLNFDAFEAVPAALLGARGNATARALAEADWVLRRKRDGRYLAVATRSGLRALMPQQWTEVLGRNTSEAVWQRLYRCSPRFEPAQLSMRTMRSWLERLGVGPAYARERGLQAIAEPARLCFAGYDRYARPLWLTAATAVAWQALKAAAARDGVILEAISGYRSHAYQFGILERKLARGVGLADILAVNAAPGFSEHHSGRALDLSTPGEAAAEESFEATAAFAWLGEHAGRFGFAMSYPRDNPHGIVYEPWHWCLKP